MAAAPSPARSGLAGLDRGQQQHPGGGDADDANRCRLGGRVGKGTKPPPRLLANRRHEIFEYQSKNLVVQLAKDRQHRQRAERDHRQRHQRNKGGIAQRPARGKAAVGIEPAQRVKRKSDGVRCGAAQPAAHMIGAFFRLCRHLTTLALWYLVNGSAASNYLAPARAAWTAAAGRPWPSRKPLYRMVAKRKRGSPCR